MLLTKSKTSLVPNIAVRVRQHTCNQASTYVFSEHCASLAPALKASRAPGTWPPHQCSYPLYPPHWPPMEGFLNKSSPEYLTDDFLWEPLCSWPRVLTTADLLTLLQRGCIGCKRWTSWWNEGSLPLPL